MKKNKINEHEKESVRRLLDSEKMQKLEDFLSPEKVKYDFLQDSEEAEVLAEIDFDALVDLSSQDLGKINAEKFEEDFDKILFYCKTCKEETEVSRLPSKKKKVQFQCNSCQGKDIIYGTARGVREYYERRK